MYEVGGVTEPGCVVPVWSAWLGPLVTLSMILSAACSAAAAGKYTLTVTQAANKNTSANLNGSTRRIWITPRWVGGILAAGHEPSLKRSAVYPMSTHDHVLAAHALHDLRHKLRPVHPPGVADDVDPRDTPALHDVIAFAVRLDAGHEAHFVAQLAVDSYPVVAEPIEESQHAGLQCFSHSARAAADT